VVVGDVVEINLGVDHVIDGQSRSFDDEPYIVQCLFCLLSTTRRRATIWTARSLPADIDVVSGIDPRRINLVSRAALTRSDRTHLILCENSARKQNACEKGPQNAAGIHGPQPILVSQAAFFRAAPSTARNRCPTIISSPGLMVIETSSMWSGALRSLRVGLGLPSRTEVTRLGLSAPSTSMTGSPARRSRTQSERLYPQACWSHETLRVGYRLPSSGT